MRFMMKVLMTLLVSLFTFSSMAFDYQVMGEYRSREGDSLQFNYTDFKTYPVGLNIEFIKDTEFDYLRNISLILTLAQYHQIFNQSYEVQQNIALSETRDLIASKTSNGLKIEIVEYTNEKRKKVGATQTLNLEISQNKILSMNIVATKMRAGVLFSYGQKEAYQSSAKLEKIKDGLEYSHTRLVSQDDFNIFK